MVSELHTLILPLVACIASPRPRSSLPNATGDVFIPRGVLTLPGKEPNWYSTWNLWVGTCLKAVSRFCSCVLTLFGKEPNWYHA